MNKTRFGFGVFYSLVVLPCGKRVLGFGNILPHAVRYYSIHAVVKDCQEHNRDDSEFFDFDFSIFSHFLISNCFFEIRTLFLFGLIEIFDRSHFHLWLYFCQVITLYIEFKVGHAFPCLPMKDIGAYGTIGVSLYLRSIEKELDLIQEKSSTFNQAVVSTEITVNNHNNLSRNDQVVYNLKRVTP